MDIASAIQNMLQTHTYWDFGLLMVLATWLLLKYVPYFNVESGDPKKDENKRVYTHAAVCLVGTILFSAFWGYEVPKLVISSMCSVAFYQWIVKSILNLFGSSYKKAA